MLNLFCFVLFRIQNIEREKTTHIYNKHGEFHDFFTQFQEIETKGMKDRQTESKYMYYPITKWS